MIPYHGSDGVFGFAWDVRGGLLSVFCVHEGWDRKFGCSKDTLQDALVLYKISKSLYQEACSPMSCPYLFACAVFSVP
jgi:hypothetical protein